MGHSQGNCTEACAANMGPMNLLFFYKHQRKGLLKHWCRGLDRLGSIKEVGRQCARTGGVGGVLYTLQLGLAQIGPMDLVFFFNITIGV